MTFSSSLLVLALGIFTSASPTPSRDTVPNTSVLPLTVSSVLQTLKVAVDAILRGIGQSLFQLPFHHHGLVFPADSIVAAEGPAGSAGSVAPLPAELANALNTATTSLTSLSPGDAGVANEDLATFVASILDSVNTALNKLVPKVGLDELLTPLDGAPTGLLTGLGGILPPVLALVGGILIPVGGIVGGLLSGLGLAAL
ncbi:hypothetical protein FB451DRAFT_1162397 [Mycena latifolia]|nr:hypothetical protein FB451DRAFT_1162397 [Mycena latifolia]